MSVAFATSGNYVACGGMDNMCTVYDVNNRDPSGAAKIVRELAGYEGVPKNQYYNLVHHIVF